MICFLVSSESRQEYPQQMEPLAVPVDVSLVYFRSKADHPTPLVMRAGSNMAKSFTLMLTVAPFVFCSYKLWYNYLKQRRKQVKSKCVTDPSYEEVNNCHERALVFMHKVQWLVICLEGW